MDFGTVTQKPMVGKRPARNIITDASIFVLMTCYLIAVVAKGGQAKSGFELAVVIYVFVSLRLLARHVSMSQTIYKVFGDLSQKLTKSLKLDDGLQKNRPMTLGILGLDAILLVGSSALLPLPDGTGFADRLQSLLGIATFIGLTAAFSRDFRSIPWHTVAVGILIQYFIAILVLKTSVGYAIFKYLSTFISSFLKFSLSGAFFIFGEFVPDNFAKNVLPYNSINVAQLFSFALLFTSCTIGEECSTLLKRCRGYLSRLWIPVALSRLLLAARLLLGKGKVHCW